MLSHLTVYSITLSDGTTPFTISPGTANDTGTSLTLPGQNHPNYGQFMDENLVHLLENFANTSAPANELIGQLWFDKNTNEMKMWDGSTWDLVNAAALAGLFVNVTGDTMTGDLVMSGAAIGIGTTPTTYDLEVAGTIGTTGSVVVGDGGSADIELFGNLLFKNGTAGSVYSPDTTRYVTVSDSYINLMGGNVGVGIASPSQKLVVNDAGGGSDNMVLSQSSAGASVFMQADTASFGVIGTLSNHPLKVVINNVEQMRIDSSGNVGIGGTPTYKLDLIGAGSQYLNIVGTAGTSTSGIILAGNAGTMTATIEHYQNSLKIGTGGSERMRITSAGDIGIGVTPSGTYKLEVSGSGSFSTNVVASRVKAGDGNVTDVGIGFSADANTGLVRPAADQLNVVAGGSTIANFNTNGVNMQGKRVENIGNPDSPDDAISQSYADNRYVNVTGDTMTGFLNLVGNPTSNLHAATKQYVDSLTSTGLGIVSQQIAATGWIHFDNGLQLVWSSVTSNFDTPPFYDAQTFPRSFTGNAWGVIGSINNSGDRIFATATVTSTGFLMYTGDTAGGFVNGLVAFWVAFGYRTP